MVIGRFAPTPSGRMHIGNVYAMLGAWLSARAGGPERTSRTGGGAGDADCPNNVNRVDGMSGAADPGDADGGRGRMLLRIEDIDTPRVLPDADRWIMDDLAWLGLDWDGEPVYQSRRLDIYEQALRALQGIDLRDAAAFGGRDGVDGTETTALIYPCFCSRADIRAASAPQEGDRFVMYPGTCRRALAEHPRQVEQRLANGDRHSLRIAMPVAGDARAAVTVHDRVFGNCRFDLPRDLGDTVAHPQLMPPDPITRARTRMFIYGFERELYQPVRVLENHAASEEAREAARKSISAQLQQFSGHLAKNKYFLGEDFSMLDICIAPLLWRLDYYKIELPKTAKAIQIYAERVFSRPAFMESMTPSEKVMRR